MLDRSELLVERHAAAERLGEGGELVESAVSVACGHASPTPTIRVLPGLQQRWPTDVGYFIKNAALNAPPADHVRQTSMRERHSFWPSGGLQGRADNAM